MLNLGNNTIEWDPKNKKQIDEAKKIYIEARKENRIITDIKGNLIDKFSPELEGINIKEQLVSENEIMVRLVNESGDERIMWNVGDPHQVKEASQKFQEYIKRGWKAYGIKANGDRSQRIFAFDSSSEEIIFDEKNNIRERLKSFSKQFKKIEILPRTFPG